MADHPPRALVNGRVWTGRGEAEAIGLRNGRIAAVGSNREVREAVGGEGEVDLEGRRVIPGLIDSHVHLVRAGLVWNDLVRWDDVTSLAEGLERIARAADASPPGSWLRVLGGWHPGGLAERRGPSPEDLDRVAPRHPVYVQLLYEEAVANRAALEAAAVDEEDPPGGWFERDARTGLPTGRLRGAGAFRRLLDAVPPPDRAAAVASTRALMADFNRSGVTGVIDPGGFGVLPESYGPLFQVWDEGDMTLRVRLYLVPGERGGELEQVREWVRYVHPGFGDDLLRYVGMGEILSYGCHDMEGVQPFSVTPEARRELAEISRLLAEHGWPAHVHAILDSTIDAVLDVWEELDREVGVAGRRFSLAHAEPIGDANLERAARLGVGIAVQDRLIFRAKDSAALWGEDVARRSPPLRTMLELGIPVGAGTDATVVTPHDPWRCIWWLVTGGTLDGGPERDPSHRLTREEALRLYTEGSAWFSLEEGTRGRLERGRLADLAVLSEDCFQVPDEEIPQLSSLLTVVGGRVVHTAGPFQGLGDG